MLLKLIIPSKRLVLTHEDKIQFILIQDKGDKQNPPLSRGILRVRFGLRLIKQQQA